MKILVCISVVPDTTTRIQLAGDGRTADMSQVQWIINPWDELALTRAVELREKQSDLFESVTVLTVGQQPAEAVLRKALAVGADQAIRIAFSPVDSWQTASQIAEVIREEKPGLVLCGIESSDYNSSATGAMAAALAGYPLASNVSSLEADEKGIILVQETSNSRETIRMSPPLLAVVQKGIALEPRIPAMRGIMLARQKPLAVRHPIDISYIGEIMSMELPPQKAACRMSDAENLDELVQELRNVTKAF